MQSKIMVSILFLNLTNQVVLISFIVNQLLITQGYKRFPNIKLILIFERLKLNNYIFNAIQNNPPTHANNLDFGRRYMFFQKSAFVQRKFWKKFYNFEWAVLGGKTQQTPNKFWVTYFIPCAVALGSPNGNRPFYMLVISWIVFSTVYKKIS